MAWNYISFYKVCQCQAVCKMRNQNWSLNILAKHLLASLDFSFIASFWKAETNILHGYNTRSRVRTHQAYVFVYAVLLWNFYFKVVLTKLVSKFYFICNFWQYLQNALPTIFMLLLPSCFMLVGWPFPLVIGIFSCMRQ